MGYYVKKIIKDQERSEYLDRTVLFEGRLWYATGQAPPTQFETQEEVEEAISKMPKESGCRYELEEIYEDLYYRDA